jgi:2Fe-2S ferredoxin
MKLNVTNRSGTMQPLEFSSGDTLMQLLREANIDIAAECDGNCVCATCHVYIDPSWLQSLGDVGEEEESMLDEACKPEDNSRLSCQLVLSSAQDGMAVVIAPDWQ